MAIPGTEKRRESGDDKREFEEFSSRIGWSSNGGQNDEHAFIN